MFPFFDVVRRRVPGTLRRTVYHRTTVLRLISRSIHGKSCVIPIVFKIVHPCLSSRCRHGYHGIYRTHTDRLRTSQYGGFAGPNLGMASRPGERSSGTRAGFRRPATRGDTDWAKSCPRPVFGAQMARTIDSRDGCHHTVRYWSEDPLIRDCCLDGEAAGMWNRPPWTAPSASQSFCVAATTRQVSPVGRSVLACAGGPSVSRFAASVSCARSSVDQRLELAAIPGARIPESGH